MSYVKYATALLAVLWTGTAFGQTVVVHSLVVPSTPQVVYSPVVSAPVTPVVSTPVVSTPVASYTTYYAPAPVAAVAPTVSHRVAYPTTTYYAPAAVTAYSPVVTAAPVPVTTYSPVVTAYPSYYVGRGVVGQPTVYVPGQPVRNALRFLAP